MGLGLIIQQVIVVLYVCCMTAPFNDPYVADLPVPVRKWNQRMAQRMAKRAHTNEQGVAVCFAYNNLQYGVKQARTKGSSDVLPTPPRAQRRHLPCVAPVRAPSACRL